MATTAPDLSHARSSARSNALLGVAGALLFAGLTAVGAQVNIPLPPFGVPMTLQTLFVVLAAVCLGPRFGSLAMLAYIGAGAIGVPVFSEGNAGLLTIFGQTGGYILGFVACQPVVRAITHRRDRAVREPLAPFLALACLAAHAVIFLIGVPWLYVVRAMDSGLEPITWSAAIHGGFVVFIPAMFVKCAMAYVIGLWAVPFAERRGW